MQIVSIPDSLIPQANSHKGANILFHDYQSEVPQSKVKVDLSSHLFSFLLEGQKQLIHRESSTQINSDSFLLLRAGNCLMTERLSDKRSYNSFLFFFDKAVLEEFVLRHKLKIEAIEEEKDFLVIKKDAFIHHYLESLLLLTHEMGVIPEKLRRAKFEELMLYLLDSQGPEVIHFFLEKKLSPQTLNFKKVIEQNLENKLSLDELAFLCNMSVSTFKRKFMEHYQSSPSKWFLEKRMEQAEYMLRVQRLKPSEIYFDLGFSNLSSFSHAFKNRYGTSPAKYGSKLD